MAQSGTITGSRPVSNSPYLKLEWKVISQNALNNSSRVEMKLYLVVDYSIGMGQRTGALEGQSFSYQGIYSPGTYPLTTKYKTVYHNSDGTKTDTLDGYYNLEISWSGQWIGRVTVSGSATYPKIARRSQVTVKNSSGQDVSQLIMGSSATISINKASSDYRHTLRYKFEGRNGTITSKTTSSTYSWTIPTFYSALTSKDRRTMTVFCDTYSDNDLLGTSSYSFTAILQSTYKPSISTINATVINPSNVPSTYQNDMIQNLSKLKLSVSASTYDNYSSLVYGTGIEWDINKKKAYGDNYTTGIIQDTSLTVKARIKDSRGRWSDWKSMTYTFTKYEKPQIVSLKAVRATSNGKDNPSGTFAQVNVNFKSSTNSNYVRIDRYPVGSSFINVFEQYYDDKDFTVTKTISGVYASKAYRIGVSIKDKYGQVVYAHEIIQPAEYTLTLGKDSVGINRLPPSFKGLGIHGEIRADGLGVVTQADGLKITLTDNTSDMAFIFKIEEVLGNTSITIQHANLQSGIAFTLGGVIAVKKRGTWEWL